MNVARQAWLGIEAVHAVVYFAPEAADAYRRLGLKGFWMGYFASRAAALGPVGPEVVEATFHGFAPAMVRRALPDAWTYASPADIADARRDAATSALRRLLVDVDVDVDVTEAADLAERAAAAASSAGRPLFAAHRALPTPTDPFGRLWHAATLLREHRGDGHVATLVVHGFDGLQAHVLQAATGDATREVLQPNRGWTDEEWEAAERDLRARNLLDATIKADIEARTDAAAAGPYAHIDVARLVELLEPLRRRIVASAEIPFPNPMGLPSDATG